MALLLALLLSTASAAERPEGPLADHLPATEWTRRYQVGSVQTYCGFALGGASAALVVAVAAGAGGRFPDAQEDAIAVGSVGFHAGALIAALGAHQSRRAATRMGRPTAATPSILAVGLALGAGLTRGADDEGDDVGTWVTLLIGSYAASIVQVALTPRLRDLRGDVSLLVAPDGVSIAGRF